MQNLTNTPKRIIYLDQGAISNIAKVLDPDFPRRERLLKSEPFWLELYKKLDRLRRLQLIVCPQSYFHLTESMISTNISFESLQYVYSYLSNGCRFDDQVAIRDLQIQYHFINHLRGHPERDPEISADMVMSGNSPNEWSDRRRVTTFEPLDLDKIRIIRAQREELYRAIGRAFTLWQQARVDYLPTVKEEAHNLGRAIIEAHFSYINKWAACTLGLELPKSPLDLLPPPSSFLFTALSETLRHQGISGPLDQIRKINEYLHSQHILRVPFINLSSMLFAAIARRAPDTKDWPNEGTATDVMAIAALLPYCHAMFVDNPMRGHLRDQPLREEVARFGTQIFSYRSRTEFLSYLNDIEASADERHIRCVNMVYGELRLDPFLDLIVQWKRQRERVEPPV